MNSSRRISTVFTMIGALLAACSGGNQAPATAGPQLAAEASGEDVPSRVCGLLTREQVNRIVPGHDGGKDKDTSEATLLTDVALEHCQYLAAAGTDLRFLDVFVWTATSDVGVESLPAHLRRCDDDDCRKLDTDDSSFLAVWSESPHVVVGGDRQILEISLTGSDAATQSDALVELARAAAARLGP